MALSASTRTTRLATLPGVALLVVLVFALLACGGEGDQLSDRLLVVRNEGIAELALGNDERILIPNPEGSLLIEPALSPDGNQIAYVRQLVPVVLPDEPAEFGMDIYLAESDGNRPRLALAHQEQNEQIRAPAWLPDGKRMLVSVQRIAAAEVTASLELFDIASGERTVVVEDAIRPAVSHDGSRIAYVRQDENLLETLWVANIDGSNTSQLVGQEDGLGAITSPRFSPDDNTIAFGASLLLEELVASAAGPRYVSTSGARRSVGRALNGLPMDLWTVPAAGGEPKLLAGMALDNPGLAWSGDGARIFVLAGLGIFVFDALDGTGRWLGSGTFHGQLDWIAAR